MARRSTKLNDPKDYVVGTWPTGPIAKGAPAATRHAQTVAIVLGEALDGKNVSDVASDADLSRNTVYELLAGTTWPDIVTLAKLEEVLDVRLWPDGPANTN